MIVGTKNLPALRQAAYDAIDAAAESCRQIYTTPGYGQAMVYLQKLDEAQRFVTAYPAATSPGVPTAADAVKWPFVSAELGITATTMWSVAHAVVAAAEQWRAAAPQIETLRLGAKMAVKSATSAAAILAARSVTWPKPVTTDSSRA